MNAKVFTNENFVALPKYNFGARSFETNKNRLFYHYWHVDIMCRLCHYSVRNISSPVHHNLKFYTDMHGPWIYIYSSNKIQLILPKNISSFFEIMNFITLIVVITIFNKKGP